MTRQIVQQSQLTGWTSKAARSCNLHSTHFQSSRYSVVLLLIRRFFTESDCSPDSIIPSLFVYASCGDKVIESGKDERDLADTDVIQPYDVYCNSSLWINCEKRKFKVKGKKTYHSSLRAAATAGAARQSKVTKLDSALYHSNSVRKGAKY